MDTNSSRPLAVVTGASSGTVFMPESAKAAMHARMAEPGSAKK